jgi:hypothetical protein
MDLVVDIYKIDYFPGLKIILLICFIGIVEKLNIQHLKYWPFINREGTRRLFVKARKG